MSSILDMPLELFYFIARCGIDLLALGALLRSCKMLNELLCEDLRLQKIFLDNTPPSMGGKGTSVRRRYIDSKTRYGIRCNEPKIASLSFEVLTPKAILKSLELDHIRMRRQMKQFIILDDVYKHDADKVLDFIIEKSFENSSKEEKPSAVIELLSFLFGTFIDMFLLSKDDATEYINTLKSKKVISTLLRHMHEQQTIIFGSIISTPVEDNWSKSGMAAQVVMILLFKLFKSFPQYKFDVNALIRSDNRRYEIKPGFDIHPLEFCIAFQLHRWFNLLITLGAKFDKLAPYLPMALLHNQLNGSSLVKQLMNYHKCDINLPLPKYLEFNSPTTILGHTLSAPMSYGNYCFVEYLLLKGAKLLKEEEEKYLSLQPTDWAYKIAKLQQENSLDSDLIHKSIRKVAFPQAIDLAVLEGRLSSLSTRSYNNVDEANVHLAEILEFEDELSALATETVLFGCSPVGNDSTRIQQFIAKAMTQLTKLKDNCRINAQAMNKEGSFIRLEQ